MALGFTRKVFDHVHPFREVELGNPRDEIF
jgi:hypothetical protein